MVGRSWGDNNLIDEREIFNTIYQTRSEGMDDMSKGHDRKKDEKKKPMKTLMEKRAAKRAKKENRGISSITPSPIIKRR